MKHHILSILAFMAITFAAQGTSHFVVNKAHFDAVGFLREEPIMILGFATMIVQGGTLSLALWAWKGGQGSVMDGLKIAAVFGAFLVSYIMLSEPAKYTVPSIPRWVLTELVVGTLQFGLFGLVIGAIHRRSGRGRSHT